jgi:long-subunit fatty acid transport protein
MLVTDIGWNDQYLSRAGAAYDVTKRLTARIGYSYATNPVSAPGALLTFPAYGFQVAAVGVTWKICGESDVSIAFDRSFNESVSTTASRVDAFQSHSTENHDQYTAQLQFGTRF